MVDIPNISIATRLCHDVHVAIIRKRCNLRVLGNVWRVLESWVTCLRD
jgi:hypothetical protein